MNTKTLRHLMVALCVLGAVGCASHGAVAPNDLAVKAETLLEQADSKGADEKAAEVYASAEENFNAATAAMKEEEYARARELFERSLVDSEYAIVLVEAQLAQKSEQEVEQTLNTLENQL